MAFWYHRIHAPIVCGPGALVRHDPVQVLLPDTSETVRKEGWSLNLLAQYTLNARALGLRHYRDDDSASLAPYDLAVGWGRMSDEANLERLHITQENRFLHWHYWGKAPIAETEIYSHTANIHLIPADDVLAQSIASIRVGSIVKMAGWLVEATHPESDKPWRSSLSRVDKGEGACEIFYVRSLAILH